MIVIMICPSCTQKNSMEAQTCTKCGEDLELYSRVYYGPDLLYNLALNMLEQSEYKAAIELLSAAHKMKPGDTGIIELLIDLYIRVEDYNSAIEKCVLLLEIDSNHQQALELLDKLSDKINREDERKESLNNFFQKSISDLYRETAGEPQLEKSVPEEVTAGSRTAEEDETPPPVEQESSEFQRIRKNMVLFAVSGFLLMVVGFSAFYWLLSDDLAAQTTDLSSTTVGEIDNLAEDLDLKITGLETRQEMLAQDISDSRFETTEGIEAVLNDLSRTDQRFSDLELMIQSLEGEIQELEGAIKDLENEVLQE